MPPVPAPRSNGAVGAVRVALRPAMLGWLALCLAAAAVMGLLGSWQLGRWESSGAQARARPVVPLESLTAPARWPGRGVAGRVVQVQGRYDGGGVLLAPGRPAPRGGGRGFAVLAALRTADGDVVPVVRGWVAGPDDPAVPPPPGPVTVTGVVLPPETSAQAGVDAFRRLPAGQVAYFDTAELVGRPPYADPRTTYRGLLLLQQETGSGATRARPEVLPPPAADDGRRWRNLAYAAQWWLFAAAAVGFWGVTVWRTAADERAAQRGEPDAAAAGAGVT